MLLSEKYTFLKNCLVAGLAFYVVAISPATGQSENPQSVISIESKVDRDKILIGDVITYSVIVRRNVDVQVEMPPLGANLGMFEIRDYHVAEPKDEANQVIEQTDYLISTFDTGEFEIPPLGIRYTVGTDSTVQELHTESIKINVESLKPSEEGDIRDINMPRAIPRNYRNIIFIGVVGFLVIAIGGLGFFFFRRYKQGKSLIPMRVKPPRPPHEIALEELQILVESDLIANGQVKNYYINLSEIIRRYIEGRFFIIAMEMTTSQLLHNMREAHIETAIIEMAEEFFDSCDLVKFAKYIPTKPENEQTTQQAFDFVNESKLVIEEETDESEGESATVAHVEEEANGEAATITEAVEVVKADDENSGGSE